MLTFSARVPLGTLKTNFRKSLQPLPPPNVSRYSALNYTCIVILKCRGAPICKITNIPITDIFAMKITNSDTGTDSSIM